MERRLEEPSREFVQGFIDAFNDGDVEAMVDCLDPEVELFTMKGLLTFVTRQWFWAEDGSAAGDPEEVAFLFERRNGKVVRWQPFADRSEGLRAAGLA